MEATSKEGLVLRVDAKLCHVEVEGRRLQVPLAGKLFEAPGHEQRPIAPGDRVVLRQEPTGLAIDAVLPRSSQLHRRAAREGEARSQVLAANITLVLVVASVVEPPLQPELIDGVLAGAERERIPATLVLTKLDRDRKAVAAHWAALYRGLGYRVFAVSTAPGHRTEPELAELGALLHGNRTVLCGLSGVGKSALLNALVPGLRLRVGSLSRIRQGRHTTSHTELIPLPGGGHVLDTPGVRSFHLFHVGSQETQFLFREIGARLPGCSYRNCLHLEEPGCAVRSAVAAGTIAPSRYSSYATMVAAALAQERGDRGGEGSVPRRPGR